MSNKNSSTQAGPKQQEVVRPKAKHKPRVLVFIVAYNAEKTITDVLARIPRDLSSEFDVEVLIIDDASSDATFERGDTARRSGDHPFPLHVLFNPENQGYGGNQKIGYHFAIENGFDFVALVHGDGQYAPEELPNLLAPLRDDRADAVFGSRMMRSGEARSGGMPLYKFVGNRILSWIENRLLGLDLSEFHSGYRIYSVTGLKQVPFWLNTNDFHFDAEIIIQFARAGLRIIELPIPTYYGDEICHVNGLKYAAQVVSAAVRAWLQDLNLLYERKFDCSPTGAENQHYVAKFDWLSPHSLTLNAIPDGARVLDLGCAGGYVGAVLKERRNAYVVGVDLEPFAEDVVLDRFVQHDLDANDIPVEFSDFDHIVILDIVEHLNNPEAFVDQLRHSTRFNRNVRIIVSTANVAFLVTRLLLLFGQFNYGKRGILDLTHRRLFTFSTLRKLFSQSGFEIKVTRKVPLPWPLVFGNNMLSRLLLWINGGLCKVFPTLFSYQILMIVRPQPHLAALYRDAQTQSQARSAGAQ